MAEVLALNEFQLTNFRCFEQVSSTLHPRATVFVAENGAGKSTVLDALGVALAALINPVLASKKRAGTGLGLRPSDARATFVAPPYRESSYPVRVLTVGNVGRDTFADSSDCEWSVSLDAHDDPPRVSGPPGLETRLRQLERGTALGERDLPVVAHYGTSRSAEGVKQVKRPTIGRLSRAFGYRNALDSRANYAELTEWLAQTEWERTASRGSEWESVLQAVYSVAHRMLEPHGVIAVRYSLEERDLVAEFGVPGRPGEPAQVDTIVPMSAMADGFRATLSLVADIAFRCGALNHHFEAEAAELTEGVVLIDEIDMHLHPKWQATVVSDLVAAFPRVQFVMTTHSPLVVSSLEANQVRVIHHERGRSSIENVRGRTSGAGVDFLTDAVFGAPTRASTDFSGALQELGRLLGIGDLDAAERSASAVRELLANGGYREAERLLREYDWRRRKAIEMERERETDHPG